MKNFLLKKNSTDIKLSKKGDRHNIFRIQRLKNDHGFYVYLLENSAEKNQIFIPRFIFGRFRAAVRNTLKHEIDKHKPEPFEFSTVFLNREYFYFKSSRMDLDNLIIQDIEEREGSSGYITVSRRCLHVLDQLLYSERLQHPNDVLEEIISYHKLFQFSFVKGSQSITSQLALRKDVLQKIDRYRPSLAEKAQPAAQMNSSGDKAARHAPAAAAASRPKAHADLYKPKLGERVHEKDIKVNYREVFADKSISLGSAADSDGGKSAKGKAALSQFAIPLSAQEVKTFRTGSFHFELSTADAGEFRDRFIADRSSDFYLGFELVDALFTYNKTLKTFQFPLYYMRVNIRESGRRVDLRVKQDGRIYLNHLALAHLVEKFSDTAAGVDPIDRFFKTLLAQTINIDQLNDRIHLVRHLPVKEQIFDRTREVLFGYRDENGKGGILADLKVSGIECDLQSVCLYRAPKLQSPLDQALEHDLDSIHLIAHQSMKRFYHSLLGKFLTPELQSGGDAGADFAPLTWIPGSLPHSTRKLLAELGNHDLVLLEGPPGTGKTHTIMNLLIHCIGSGQRVLVVSDQQAAIEALMEKLQQYLLGGERDHMAERRSRELLLSAIKVVASVETGDQTLQQLIGELVKVFRVQKSAAGTVTAGRAAEKKVAELDRRIAALTEGISAKLAAHLGDDLPFEQRQAKKHEDSIAVQSLLEFLDLLLGQNGGHRQLIDAFVANRLSLVAEGMEECYQFFRIPSQNFDSEVRSLQDDDNMLSAMMAAKVETQQDFDNIVRNYPRHEIVRYLESVMRADVAAQGGDRNTITRKIRTAFRSPLQAAARKLQHMVRDQIALLQVAGDWSAQLWLLLKEIHECIRIGDRPTMALALYRSIHSRAGAGTHAGLKRGDSIQGDLEQIQDLYQQRDRIVRERFIANLHAIIDAAGAARRSAGTDGITSILALLDGLKQFSSVAESGSVFEELRHKLYEIFPIWVVRKQAVPFLLPCTEQSFDLVIVDEATQCRVDDAVSLLFRAKKMLVVGDDKQTVLQKDSSIDDYLFSDHELDEHLRSTQARGFKGGGSHIFALVKAIKQASVMLDEHYRCPADVIEFCNRYVYDNELKVMQWRLPERPPAVVVDYGEKDAGPSKKPRSGKFRGIETEMIDRYLDYVGNTIMEIEAATGNRINLETDVALCYFLLKNQPYIKFAKQKLLARLNRGEDILDGAGAALQGKERDYIFYLWDITRYNLNAFKQGDDADKRKGELNVLMSRPKKKAYHYLHGGFEQLEHDRTDISRYLWRSLTRQRQHSVDAAAGAVPATQSLLGALLKFTLANSGKRGLNDIRRGIESGGVDFRNHIVVGDARRLVDLIALAAGVAEDRAGKVVGLVDLSGFAAQPQSGQAIVDYFFQLQRASPGIDPVFIFPYELVDENSQTFRSLIDRLEQIEIAAQQCDAGVLQ